MGTFGLRSNSILPICLTIYSVIVAITEASGTPQVKWISCPKDIPPGVECGTINVPLKYKGGTSTAGDGSQTIELFLTRLKSTSTGHRQPLFFNPGGPGVPAAALIADGIYVPNLGFSANVREAFDIVGVDPRGVGHSSPVLCDADIFNQRVPTFVKNDQDFRKLVYHNRRLGESCRRLSGPIVDNLDVIHTVKDHEVVRQALGATHFNYFGLSYGSLLGQQYIELYPKKVGRMALDGIVAHSQSETDTLITEASTYERTLDKFFEWCDSNSTCALHGRNSKKIFDEVLATADKKAIPAPGCAGSCQPNVTGEDIRYNAQDFLEFYDLPVAPNWIDLAGAIAQAHAGNATILSTALATNESQGAVEGSPYAYLAIGCQDWRHGASIARQLEGRLSITKRFAPQTKGASQTYYYQSTCIGWPAKTTNGQRKLHIQSTSRAPPVLLVHSTYDPSCSPVWAELVAKQLPTSVSITRDGYGHTSHFLLGETRSVIDLYLATGKLPRNGAVYKT
ncbi:Alpha/Beta hydrolase protein [Stachybotrys elegans]|uniref:Alpha/Beta hydrolase protein n=1 Tax=Stachybotrys elegans TaxID=80388 RepID=A0A8K0SNU1_9HYPO|nr:Alpha/Beta hydrolase protein [Stachybotrys elegans]